MNSHLENEIVHIIDENIDLIEADLDHTVQQMAINIQMIMTMILHFKQSLGKPIYSELLSTQVPAIKVSNIIKTVVKCFNPDIDVEKLQRSCASYMRSDELKMISDAHNAV